MTGWGHVNGAEICETYKTKEAGLGKGGPEVLGRQLLLGALPSTVHCALLLLPAGVVDSSRLWRHLNQQAGWTLPLTPLTKTKPQKTEAHSGGRSPEVV